MSSHKYVPPGWLGVVLMVPVSPSQIVSFNMLNDGISLTVIFADVVFAQPFTVYNTEYVEVTDGETVILEFWILLDHK